MQRDMKWSITLLVPPCSFRLECGEFVSVLKLCYNAEAPHLGACEVYHQSIKCYLIPKEHMYVFSNFIALNPRKLSVCSFALQEAFSLAADRSAPAFVLEPPVLCTKAIRLILCCKTLLAVSIKSLHFHSPFPKQRSVNKTSTSHYQST